MVQASPVLSPEISRAVTPSPLRRQRYLSYVLLSALAVVLLDLAARISFPYWSLNHYDSPNKSWIYWAVNDFQHQPQKPDIVLLGSSLMLEALNSGDATYLQKPQNVTLHHTSSCLQDDLEKRGGFKPHVFSFAIAGQMASDSFAISSTLLNGKFKPTTIVYGIAPRDLMDNTLTNVTTTETFRYLSRVGDLSKTFDASHPNFWDALDNSIGKVSFLYQHRADLTCIQQRAIKSFLHLFKEHDFENYRVPFELRRIALKELPEDVASNETMVCPYGHPPVPYLDNLAEYRQRYAHMNIKMFKNQLGYLEKLLAYGREQHINIVLVNMPLTADNLATMPPGYYQNYLTEVSALSAKYNDKLIDLNLPYLFNKGYFADSAHLNGLGGMRFFELLSDALVQNKIELSERK